jgi:hypothetical protein
MLSRILIGMVGLIPMVGAAIGIPGDAWADPPPPPPPPPNVNAYALALPSDFSVLDNRYYAFGTSDGLTCAIDRTNASYGCSGPIPAAPGGANVVSAAGRGAAAFATDDRPIFADIGPVKQLPPKTRLSFRSVSCGTDGAGMTACINAEDQSGFVLTPAGSYVLGDSPLIAGNGSGPYGSGF